MPVGPNSVIVPPVVSLPISCEPDSVNQRNPPDEVIPEGSLPAPGTGNEAALSAFVNGSIRRMLLASDCVNHSPLSGPTVISLGPSPVGPNSSTLLLLPQLLAEAGIRPI